MVHVGLTGSLRTRKRMQQRVKWAHMYN
ncbi:uncharacterized protein G2W53_043065 [Senna tora]|uniref:Uncharacterized protein n=1 Tax=Senna tora TaxID=362788 RepID=A0A834SUY7_9FABA|nr:uncharacterized protein G2W53_043065 [Senna tora]